MGGYIGVLASSLVSVSSRACLGVSVHVCLCGQLVGRSVGRSVG